MTADIRQTPFGRFFFPWYAVAVFAYVLALYPFLEVSRYIVPVRDQLVCHSLLLTAMLSATALWAAALAGAARALSALARSGWPGGLLLRCSASVALSLVVYLIAGFAVFAVRGGTPVALLDLLLANRAMGLALACLAAALYAALGTRAGSAVGGAFGRLRQLGFLLALCTAPFLLIFLGQGLRLALAPSESQSRAPQERRAPNIAIILLDALPLEKTSLSPGADDLTPSLRRLAERSFVFTRAYAPANFTEPSVATLLTGKQPARHGIFNPRMSLPGPSRGEALPAELRGAGFVTGATVANDAARPEHTKMEGFDRVYPARGIGWRARLRPVLSRFAGFHLTNMWSYDLENWAGMRFPDRSRTHPWPPERNFLDALGFLSEGGGAPRFLYVHVMPPHSPYLAESPYMYTRLPAAAGFDTRESYRGALYRSYPESDREKVGKLEKRYEENVLSVDHRLGRFLDALESAGRFRDTVIVVLSDHGEMFDTRWVGHSAAYLDDPLLRVPLVIHLPGQERKRVVDAPIGLVDVAPTLLDLAGVPVPHWMDGVSWKPVFSGGAAPARPVYSYTWDAIFSLAAGDSDSGICRMTWGDTSAVLDLRAMRLSVATPRGGREVSFAPSPAPGPGASPEGGRFEDAVRLFDGRNPVDAAGQALLAVP